MSEDSLMLSVNKGSLYQESPPGFQERLRKGTAARAGAEPGPTVQGLSTGRVIVHERRGHPHDAQDQQSHKDEHDQGFQHAGSESLGNKTERRFSYFASSRERSGFCVKAQKSFGREGNLHLSAGQKPLKAYGLD